MANWLLERRLKRSGKRLAALRDELGVIDEQLAHLAEHADDEGIRSVVSETSSATADFRRATEHADAMARHRAHVVASIMALEERQDVLLDRMVR